jgi:hypothetical protein
MPRDWFPSVRIVQSKPRLKTLECLQESELGKIGLRGWEEQGYI